MRLPDLSDFTKLELEEQLLPMFSKSGMTPSSLSLLQEAVLKFSHGFTVMEQAPLGVVDEFERQPPLFADIQRLAGPFEERLLVIMQTEPFFEFLDSTSSHVPSRLPPR
jgi:hypothetical protein